MKKRSRKKAVSVVAAILPMLLAGCGGSGGGSAGSSGGTSGDYTVLERTEGSAQITYYVQVAAGTPQSKVESILRELETKGGGKSTMVNFYDGPRDVKNMIYTCQGGTCYDSQPGR